ncbi:MAG: hypothetical protein ABIS50_19445 [Luteolibacter sp.]|uniref:hypothetical protein n=1 Tax=Luteolibacter sp. TaxID=1962973 RepID=UPI00326790B6
MPAILPRLTIPALLFFMSVKMATAAEWGRPVDGNVQPVWGSRGGLQFAISPGGFTGGDGGPRGLIRIGYPTLPEGRYDLINFIALEPIVGKARGYSELERSHFDGHQGKCFWTGSPPDSKGVVSAPQPGVISSPAPGIEELTVTLRTEKFDNGAHVRLELSLRSNAPDELRLVVRAEEDSAPLTSCILTATMGNKARNRLLWLRDETASSLRIFNGYDGPDFAPQNVFPLAKLGRNAANDVLVAMTTDEENPATTAGQPLGWEYRGSKVTQYWRKPAAGVNDSLRCAINARFMYWMSRNPIPGGLAYENFELVENFKDGAEFVFGVTKTPVGKLIKQP